MHLIYLIIAPSTSLLFSRCILGTETLELDLKVKGQEDRGRTGDTMQTKMCMQKKDKETGTKLKF